MDRLTARKVMRISTALALFAACAIAQTTGTGGSGSTTPTISAFTQEVTIPYSNIGFATPPNIPANVVQSIQGGALEIRHSITYDPTARTLRVRSFTVQPGSPNPTPMASQTSLLEDYTVDVTSVTASSVPGSTLVLVGSVRSAAITSPFGNYTGAPFIYTFGYAAGATATDPTRFNSTSLVIPGVVAFYAPTSTGTLTLGTGMGTGGNGGTGTGTNRPPVANAGTNMQTVVNQIQLNGSGSSDPDNEAITFSWRSIGRSASITNATSATPTVQLGEGFGDYNFELTVTDARGATATATVTVTYFGNRF